MTGPTSSTGTIFLSWRSWWNSFTTTRHTTRMASALLPGEAGVGDAQHHAGVEDQEGHVLEVRAQPGALQDHAPQDHVEVAGGDHVGERLDGRGHGADGEDEPREEQRRQHGGE